MLFAFDEFLLDPERRELLRDDVPLKVDALVIDLLGYLASRPDELVTHDELIEHVWGGRAVADNVVSVCMAKLRKALGHRRGEREFVVNVYGRGYRFVRPVRRQPRGSQPPGAPLSQAPLLRPFVGRAVPVARLSAALDAAREGRGRVCALMGEPGIGKTRLSEALEQQALTLGVAVAWGRARDLEGSPPLWPWVQIVRVLLDRVTPDEARARLGHGYQELSRLLPELGSQPSESVDAAAARHRASDAVTRLIALCAEQSPWLLVLDDLHRADAASLGLLAYLVDELARMKVLVLCTVRDTEPDMPPEQKAPLDYVLGHRNCERVELSRLSEAEVAAYTEAVLGHADAALSQRVYAHSEGNPFFMTELLRDVSLGHAAKPSDTALSSVALELPRQRVRSLGDEALSLLQCASVIGRSFELPLLASAAGLEPAVALEQLEEALATDVVVAAPGEFGRFAFDHELIRRVLYDALPPTERARLHLSVAAALRGQAASGKPVAAAELAHHLLAALPHGEPAAAAREAERAGLEAMRALAFSDGAELLERALGALDLVSEATHVERARLHYTLGLCRRPLDASASIEQLRKAVSLARAHQLYPMLAECGLAMVGAPGVVMIADGRGVLEDALAGLAAGDHARRATVLSHLAWCAPVCFDRERTEALVAEASREAEQAAQDAPRFVALRARIHLGAGPCQPDRDTLARVAEADAIAPRLGSPTDALWAQQRSAFLAVFASQRGDRAALDAALRPGPQSGVAHYGELHWHLDRMRVIDSLNLGQLEGAAERLGELRTRAQRMQLFAHERVCAYDALLWLSWTSSPWEPHRFPTAPLSPVPEDPPGILAIKLCSALTLQQHAASRSILGEFALRGFGRLPCDRDYLPVLASLARAAVVLDERAHAGELFELLAPWPDHFATDMSMHTQGSVSHMLGLLARSLGRAAEAAEAFEHAVARNDACELRRHAVESRLELAATLLSSGSAAGRGRARELLKGVLAESNALGLHPLHARARALAG